MNTIVVEMAFSKDTKNKVRFDAGTAAFVDNIYLHKLACPTDMPKRVKVTIESLPE